MDTLNGAMGIINRGEKDPNKETEKQWNPRDDGVAEIKARRCF